MIFRDKIAAWLVGSGVTEGASIKAIVDNLSRAKELTTEQPQAIVNALKKVLHEVSYLPGVDNAIKRLTMYTEELTLVNIISGADEAASKVKIGATSSTSESIFFTRHDGGVTIFRNGKHTVVPNSHPNFEAILIALRDKKFSVLDTLSSITDTINANGATTDAALGDRKVFAKDGKVWLTKRDGSIEQLNGTLVQRIIEAISKPTKRKFGEALIRFMDNIQDNPLKDIRAELYEFLTSGKTPITYDGCFLAYKKVGSDFKDIYTRTMDNSPGKLVRMDPDKVNRNRNELCSHGLHFASRGYLSHYSDTLNNRIVIVKVNPKDVYAIPTDYNYQKGRASEYLVVGEFKGNTGLEDAFLDSFIDDDNKESVAPKVKFHGSLKASLEQVAESYLIAKDGKVNVVKVDSEYLVVRKNPDDKNPAWYDIKGKMWLDEHVKSMSIETKSVRQAVKFAIAELERIVAKRLASQRD